MTSILDIVSPPLKRDISEKMLRYYQEAKDLEFVQKYAPAMTSYGKFLEFVAKAVFLYSGGVDNKKFVCKDYSNRIVQSGEKNDVIRLLIPLAIDSAYSIRNKRDVAHPSITMDTSPYDCVYVSATCDWILGELIVELGNIGRDKSREVLNSIMTKRFPFVYENADGKLIILSKELTAGKEALVKLYVSNNPLSAIQIQEGSNHTIQNFRTQLRNLELDKKVSKLNDGRYELLPPGANEAEQIIKSLTEEYNVLEGV